jgi:hypothetical protein
MTDTAALYYDYVIRGSSRRDFLDALSTEEDVMPTDDEIIAKQQADIEQIKRDIEHIKRVMKNRGLLEERKDEE